MVMLSAVDGPPWTKHGSRAWSEETIHGCRTWSGGTDCGGTIGSVTDPPEVNELQPNIPKHGYPAMLVTSVTCPY